MPGAAAAAWMSRFVYERFDMGPLRHHFMVIMVQQEHTSNHAVLLS
jgi:hypothetical protein